MAVIEKKVGSLSFASDENGAELHSIKLDGEEFLWQCGDSWKRYAPILFPFICSPKDRKYRAGGKEYTLPANHGFARDSVFTLIRQTDSSVSYELVSNDTIKQWYPYDFRLEVTYEIFDGKLYVNNLVENIGADSMYFYLGGHPAFIADIEGGNDVVVYDKPETVMQSTPDGERCVLDNEQILVLNRSQFDNDVIMKDAPASRMITLRRANNNVVKLSFPDSNCIAVWTVAKDPGAQFICLEPWTSVPVYADDEFEDIERKPHAIRLDPEQIYNYRYIIEAGKV